MGALLIVPITSSYEPDPNAVDNLQLRFRGRKLVCNK